MQIYRSMGALQRRSRHEHPIHHHQRLAQPAAARHQDSGFHPCAGWPAVHRAAGRSGGRSRQDRATAGRRLPPYRPHEKRPERLVLGDEPQQAKHGARHEAPRGRGPGARAGRTSRCGGGELPPRRGRSPGHWRRQTAQPQPQAGVRERFRLWPDRPHGAPPGLRHHRAGHERPDGSHRRARRRAHLGGRSGERCGGRPVCLLGHLGGAAASAAHRPGPAGGRVDVRHHPHLPGHLGLALPVYRQAGAPRGQPPSAVGAIWRLQGPRRPLCTGRAQQKTVRRHRASHGPARAGRRPALRHRRNPLRQRTHAACRH